MVLRIPRDIFDSPKPPRLFLCQTNKEIIGELRAYDRKLNAKWNAYSELEFTIDRHYNDAITGETLADPMFDKLEGLRKVYVEGFGYFVIQDPDSSYSDNETKSVSCFSSEYETGNKYLENFYVNTGEDDSVEVIYHSSQYGENYYLDDEKYALASGYDAYSRYYYKEYSDTTHYTFTEIQIKDAADYNAKQNDPAYKPLYVTKYPNVQFYNPIKPELSLLNLVFEKIPEWKIKYVDPNLCNKVRKFAEERVAVYDFLMNQVSDTFECVIEWDTIKNEVSFYEEAEDGITDNNEVQTRYETDVYISRDNLASEISVQYSTDDIKTKLKVIGGDDLAINEINLGQNYIMNLDYYHTVDWMGQDLYDKYSAYKTLLESKQSDYQAAMKMWVGAYNIWNDLMNAVPAGNSVIQVGDEFSRLYCSYTPVYEEGATEEEKAAALNNALAALTKKLKLYKVDDDVNNNKEDNVLLTLSHDNGNRATIRVINADNTFKVRSTVTNAATGEMLTNTYTLTQWLKNEITATAISASEFVIKSIGTLGAYLCLVKDESKAELNNDGEANREVLRTYGVKLLEERQSVYQSLFVTQTEGYMSKEGAKCIASETAPLVIVVGTRWLDTSSSPLVLREYTGSNWKVIDDETNIADAANYTRYKENYEKLKAVQEVLTEKKLEANYYLNGAEIANRSVSEDFYTETVFKNIAQAYFQNLYDSFVITTVSFDASLPLYKFNLTQGSTTKEFAVYLQGTTPYVAYSGSRAVCQIIMNGIKKVTDMGSYFSLSEWERLSPFIREDEFSDSNFALTGYESEEERTYILEELKKAAEKKLKSISQPSLEFSMTMGNILALPEFDPIKDQFALGNFIRVEVRSDYVKKSRLLEVNLNFDDLSDFNATFGNLVTTKSEIDKHAELLKQAVSAGKSVASSASNWQRAVEKSNRIDDAIKDGLKDAALQVGATSGQNISWDDRGILCRKKISDEDTAYEDEQIMITNNRIVMTADDWETSKGVFGKFTYDSNHDGVPEEHFGVLADALVGGYVEGTEIYGGSMEISGNGGSFKVNKDGTVEILVGGTNAYVPKEQYDEEVGHIKAQKMYRVQVFSENQNIMTRKDQTATMVCKVYSWDQDITSTLNDSIFNWVRKSDDATSDAEWNNMAIHKGRKTLTISTEDITNNASFSCQVNIPD